MWKLLVGSLVAAASIDVGAQASPAQAEAMKHLDAITGRSGGKAADMRICKLFSNAEIERYFGQKVGKIDPRSSAEASCQWLSKDEESAVAVSIFGARHFAPKNGNKGYKPVPRFGSQGYVVPSLGDWEAGTVVGDKAVFASVSGTNKEAEVTALLDEALKRLRLAGLIPGQKTP